MEGGFGDRENPDPIEPLQECLEFPTMNARSCWLCQRLARMAACSCARKEEG